MFFQILLLCLITLIPALELRASIPYGIMGNASWGITPGLMPWFFVAALCILCNAVLGWVLYLLLPVIFQIVGKLPVFGKYADSLTARARSKLKPYVEKYGTIGVALFIGIPLPGSGVYTGSLGAFMLGMERRKFMLACLLGVIIAGTIVTALTLAVKQSMELPFWTELVIKG